MDFKPGIAGVAVLALVLAGCDRIRSGAPPTTAAGSQTPAPTKAHKYVVLSQQALEREIVFEVDAPDAPNTSREVLLDIAQSLHDTGEKRDRTVVIFRDPRGRSLAFPSGPSLSEQYANAFAVALLEPARGIKEVRFGVFN